MAMLAACVSPKVEETDSQPQTGFVKIAPGAYDSADTAIVIAKQEKQKKITFLNLKKQNESSSPLKNLCSICKFNFMQSFS